MAKIYYRLVPYLSIRCLSSCTGLCEGYQVFSLRLCLIQPVNVSNCPALISDESAGLSDAYCLSVCLQLYAFGNRKSDRSEILGHDLVVSEGVQYQISSKSDHRKECLLY